MSDCEARPGSNRNKNIHNLSSALAPELGIPTDVIEQAFVKILQNSVNDNLTLLSSTNVHNSIQDSKLVDGLSQSISLIDTDSEPAFQPPKINRKDSLSSLIEITQSGSTSINIKLPDLYISSPTVQEDSLSLVGTTAKSSDAKDANINSSDENLNRSGSILYPDEPDIYNISNNEGLTPESLQPQHLQAKQNRDIYKSSMSASEEFVQPRRESLDFQNTPKSIMPEYFSSDSDEFVHPVSFVQEYKPYMPENFDSEEDIQPKRRESLDQHVKQDQGPVNSFSNSSKAVISQAVSQKPIKNKLSETFSSEWPSLSETTKKGDPKKNSEVDLGAWGQMNVNIASAWGKPKKWSSETEDKPIEPPVTSTWNPDDVNKLTWQPIQQPKAPIFKKKKNAPVSFEIDDSDGWGAPPTKYIPWSDMSRQGYCVDLIEEQKETVFWTMQNGNWVNVTEETKITQEKKTVEYTSDGVNHKKDIRQTRTQTQRIERQGIDNLEGSNWHDIREQIRRERLGLTRPNNSETDVVNEEVQGDIIIELTDHDDMTRDSNSSEIEDTKTNSAVFAEGPRKRLGNPQWKTEKEWRLGHKVGNLINFNTLESDSKSSEDDDEPLTSASDRDESAGEISNWDKMGSVFDSYPLNNMSTERSTEAFVDIEPVKDDAWFIEDVTATIRNEQKRQEETVKEPEQNPLLINIDSNLDDATDATIINTHPPIFHGTVNNAMADLNDFIFDSINPANMSTNVMNNSELNLLSFDDDDNKILNSPDNITSIETQPQENEREKYSLNFDELDIFLRNSVITSNTEVPALGDNKFEVAQPGTRPPEIIEDSNELQKKSPDLINQSDTLFNSLTPPKSYRCERDNENKGSANEPLATADLDSNSTNAVTEKDYFVNVKVETKSYGRQELRLRYDDDPKVVTAEFCKKWGMKEYEDTLQALIHKEQKRRIRRRNKKMMIKNAKCMLKE